MKNTPFGSIKDRIARALLAFFGRRKPPKPPKSDYYDPKLFRRPR